jgi:subtilisin family serine protease
MGRAYGAVEDYEPAELVVALGDKDLVCKELEDHHQIAIEKSEDSEPLGLSLLTLNEDTVAAAGRLLRQDAGLVANTIQAKWPSGPDGIEPSDLDLLLSKLRADFCSRYACWTPDIGKNRLISPVRGLPYVSGCTEGDPSQLGLADPNPELASGEPLGWPHPRPTEPGHSVRVGLLDTRLYQNPWLTGGYLAAQDDLLEVPGSGHLPPWSLAGHATFIAGLILHQAPGAQLIIRPVMEQRALGRTWGVAKVMAEFVGTGVSILNLSFGCYTDDGQPPLVLAKAVSLVSPQILLVAAAGNHGDIEQLRAADSPLAAPWTVNLQDTTPVWPAAFAEVTAVGANDGHGQLAGFSPKAPWVDVTAPGVDVESTYLDSEVRLAFPDGNKTETFHGFACWEGTSFAAATVSGAVAANIGPGRDARQALKAVLADSQQYPEISKYEAPDA